MRNRQMPRLKFLGLLIITFFCLALLSCNQRPDSESDFQRSDRIQIPVKEFISENYHFDRIEDILRKQEFLIAQETSDYKFPPGTFLNNFTPSTGGQPIRNVIITTWRSGSTFLGDILNAMPGNFYHYEPLLDYGILQIRGPPLAKSAVRNLKRLLECDYTDMERYLDYGKDHHYLFSHNTRLWNQCDTHPNYCWKAAFLNGFCKLFPFQSMKVVRLRLDVAEELMKDEQLNVHILLLIRDPRGTLQSRKHRGWCPGVPDCDNPELLCSDMVSDYLAANKLKKLYPTRFKAMRYEDLSIDLYNQINDLFQFFRLQVHPNVLKFLDSHTKTNAGGVSSTYRDTKTAPFHWRSDLNYSEVQYIEDNCDRAMKLWGYEKAPNETVLRDFNPLKPYSLDIP